ncbi:MAG: Arc family DNA-binding protein [Comamonas sp.]|jgi:hypothetical protein|uniref:Arc family DNA-binding protein n=1 Tax=Comamonas sp. TaxID=34028 RepID=UPI00282304A0|nr:Arc family DNA-binding protein [Comamonas sp.]
MPTKTAQERPVAVRIPPDLREYIQVQAKTNFRSMSSEIAARIERSRQEDLAVQQQGAAA